jgi:hypothetical protein
MGITVLFEYNLVLVKTVVLMIENEVGIIVTASYTYLEMYVVCCGSAGVSFERNNLTDNDLVSCLYQVTIIMAVERG